jgi:hypothetical protein
MALTVNDAERAALEQLPRQLGAPTELPDELHALHRVKDYTLGHWTTETASEDAFDAAIGSDLWTVYRQVTGVLTQPRPQQIDKTVRIDRVLAPRTKLLAAGWTHGVVGIEIKRSNEKIGPAIAQAMDYSRSVWTLNQAGNSRVWLDWVFIWPMPKQNGSMASVLAQNRIGSATPGYGGGFQFKAGETNIICSEFNGTFRIGTIAPGTKAGRR